MKTSNCRIDLALSEVEYLRTARFLSPVLLAKLGGARWGSATTAVLELLPEAAEEFREAFTERLAKVGFNKEYEITPEGKLLEDLIDRFHVP